MRARVAPALCALVVLVGCSSGVVTTTESVGTGAATTTSSGDGGAGGGGTSVGGAGGASTGAGGGATSAGGAGGGATSAGGAGGGTTSAGGAGGATATGAPIVASEGAWTWIPFPDAVCANGQPTGIGVNLAKPGARVLVYLEGGGACWDDASCYVQKSAANIESGYGPAQFAATVAGELLQPNTAFDRATPANPFQHDSYVYVPYCTGDVHAGDHVVVTGAHTTHHVGHRNLAAFLARLVPTFAGTDRVVLVGSSAGGFGALVNWWQVSQAFAGARVDMIDDSGTPMPPSIHGGGVHAAAWSQAWNLAATMPPGCVDCATGLDALFPFYAKALPGSRGALLTYATDTVLPGYFGISDAEFTQGLVEVGTKDIAPSANLRYFVPGGAGHVLWWTPLVSVKGVSLAQWVTDMVNDAPGWVSLSP
jgi:hypothetical protein